MMTQFCNPTMWKYIIQDIGDTLRFMPLAAVAGIVVYLIFRVIFRNIAAGQRNLMAESLFLMYLLILIQITLLTREPGSRTTMNLKLFGTLGNARANAYVIENLILFIPFGVLLPITWKKARLGMVCTLAGLLTSMSIEIIQLLTQCGYFQIDDIVMNTLGMMCGYLIYRLTRWIK